MTILIDPEKALRQEVIARCAAYLRNIADMMERGEVSCAGVVLFEPGAGGTLLIPEEVREDAAIQIKKFGCRIIGYGAPPPKPTEPSTPTPPKPNGAAT